MCKERELVGIGGGERGGGGQDGKQTQSKIKERRGGTGRLAWAVQFSYTPCVLLPFSFVFFFLQKSWGCKGVRGWGVVVGCHNVNYGWKGQMNKEPRSLSSTVPTQGTMTRAIHP